MTAVVSVPGPRRVTSRIAVQEETPVSSELVRCHVRKCGGTSAQGWAPSVTVFLPEPGPVSLYGSAQRLDRAEALLGAIGAGIEDIDPAGREQAADLLDTAIETLTRITRRFPPPQAGSDPSPPF